MSEAFFEKIDVFLPGQGETLAQAPAHHWEQAERASAQIYYSTQEPEICPHPSDRADQRGEKSPCRYANRGGSFSPEVSRLRRVWCPSAGVDCHNTRDGNRRVSKTARFDGGRRQPS